MADKFNYSYSAPAKSERRKIENIRKQYSLYEGKACLAQVSVEATIGNLIAMHRRVTVPPKINEVVHGIIGTLIFGAGMSLSLVWENYLLGVPVGLAGIVALCVVYPVYRWRIRRNQRIYGAQIIALCDKLLNEENK